ncbi:hypothetical protein ACVWWR_002937 [Bradyrhizobium sp. LM3.2]|jgi:hypothetical protein
MSALLPIMAWLLLIASGFRPIVRIRTGRRVFYAPRRPGVFPEAAILCLILLQAGAHLRERTVGERRV